MQDEGNILSPTNTNLLLDRLIFEVRLRQSFDIILSHKFEHKNEIDLIVSLYLDKKLNINLKNHMLVTNKLSQPHISTQETARV